MHQITQGESARKIAHRRSLHPYRHTRLRRPPRPEFRDQLFEAAGFENLTVNLAGGSSRRLQCLLETEGADR